MEETMLFQESKLKILITTDLYTVATNGVVTSVQNLFDELTANGHDVRILTISGDLHSHKEGAVYYIRSVPLKGVYPDLRMPTSFRFLKILGSRLPLFKMNVKAPGKLRFISLKVLLSTLAYSLMLLKS